MSILSKYSKSSNSNSHYWKSLFEIEKHKEVIQKIAPENFSDSFFDSLNSSNFRTKFRNELNKVFDGIKEAKVLQSKDEIAIFEIKESFDTLRASLLLPNKNFVWDNAKVFFGILSAKVNLINSEKKIAEQKLEKEKEAKNKTTK